MTQSAQLLSVTLSTAAATAVGVAISASIKRFKRARPISLDETNGTIGPEKVSAWAVVLSGLGFALIGVIIAVSIDQPMVLSLSAFGLIIAAFMAPSLTAMHNVHWTAEGIEGPSNLFGLTLSRQRTAIAWRDIVNIGKTKTGYWYVESLTGQRVYWSYLYKGYGVLFQTIAKKCDISGT